MKKPKNVIEVFLQPGEHYFGDRQTRVRTLLGSCVAVTMWHPILLVGGMCHFMLPTRAKRVNGLDGKYADEALELLFQEARDVGTHPREYQVKLFGGGNMFPKNSNDTPRHVGLKNTEVARSLMQHHGLEVMAEHMGGQGHRNVLFDIWSGDVWMKHQSLIKRDCANCEAKPICLAA